MTELNVCIWENIGHHITILAMGQDAFGVAINEIFRWWKHCCRSCVFSLNFPALLAMSDFRHKRGTFKAGSGIGPPDYVQDFIGSFIPRTLPYDRRSTALAH